MTLGVIFFLIILSGVYFYVADPLQLKPLLFGNDATEATTTRTTASTSETTSDVRLSESQEKALETFGIDPADVPSDITPEQEACFIETLGEERVAEIQAGDSPTATEFFKAKDCI